jgi:hypothetical protein
MTLLISCNNEDVDTDDYNDADYNDNTYLDNNKDDEINTHFNCKESIQRVTTVKLVNCTTEFTAGS